MTDAPQLFDRHLLMRRRARAGAAGDFLHREALAETGERLQDVNRRFDSAALVWPGAACWADLAAHPNVGAVTTIPMGADEVLPLSGGHDLIVAGLSLHGANDPLGLLIQMRRALKPDGLLIAPMFGGETLRELRESLLIAESETTGGAAPRVHPMGEVRDLGALLQRAGLALPVADAVTLPVTYESPFALMRDLRLMGETNVLAARDRRPLRRATWLRMAQVYADRFANGERLTATFEIVFLTGWAPSESQQKPLRPGSATMRLADALKPDD